MTDLIDMAGPIAAGPMSPDVERWAERTTTLIAEQALRLALYRDQLPEGTWDDYPSLLERALNALPPYKTIRVSTELLEALATLPESVLRLVGEKVRRVAT